MTIDTEIAAWNGVPQDWGKGFYRDVPVCNFVNAARQRQMSDLQRSIDDPNFPYYYDDEEARRVIWFFKQLRHVEGQWYGQPFDLADWQEWDIARPLFCWKRRADNSRRFRIAYLETPRKNGKSSLAGGFGDFLFICDRE